MNFWTTFTWQQVGISCLIGLVICEINLYFTSAVLHRGMCHRAIEYPAWLKRAVAFWLWITVCIPPLTWIAAHLHHHANADAEDDPHSPAVKSFWKVLFLTWYYVPDWVRRNRQLADERYLASFRKERFLWWMDRLGTANGNFYIQIVLSLALGPIAIAFWISRIVPYMLASGYVNAIGHTSGTRPYGAIGTDASGVLQKFAGYLAGGEPLGHNFHHRHPSSPRFRLSRFDPGFWFGIRILQGVSVGRRWSPPPGGDLQKGEFRRPGRPTAGKNTQEVSLKRDR